MRSRRWVPCAATVLLLALLVSCGAVSAKPPVKPSPSPTPCPVQAAPGVWVRGCVVLYDGENVDLDEGQVNVPSYDLAFSQGALTLAPGTLAAYLGVLDFNSISPSTIEGANLGTAGYQLSQFASGGVLAVRTGQGRPSKVRFDVIGKAVLHLSFFTYSSSSVPASNSTPPPSSHQPTPTPSPSPSPTPS